MRDREFIYLYNIGQKCGFTKLDFSLEGVNMSAKGGGGDPLSANVRGKGVVRYKAI